MKTTQETENQNQNKGLSWWAICLALLIILITVSYVAYVYRPINKPDVYLEFQHNITNSTIPRYECGIYKMSNEDFQKLDYEKLYSTGITFFAYDDLAQVPKCKNGEMYLNVYNLSTLDNSSNLMYTAYRVVYYETDFLNSSDYEAVKDLLIEQKYGTLFENESEFYSTLEFSKVK